MVKMSRYFLYTIGLYSVISVAAIAYIINEIETYNDVNSKLSVLVAIFFVIHTWLIYQREKKISLSLIFIWLCYLFWLARIYVQLSGYVQLNAWLSYGYFGETAYVEATKYCTIGIILVAGGLLFGASIKKAHNPKIPKYNLTKRNVYPLLFVTFFVTLLQMVRTIYYSFTQGYEVAHTYYFENRFFSLLVKLFPIFVYYLLVMNQNNKLKARLIYILFIAFEALQMAGGERAFPVLYIIFITYLYFRVVEKIKFRYLVLVGIGAFLLLNLLLIVRFGRYSGSFDAQLFSIYDVIMLSFEEFGGTLNVIMKGFHDMNYHANGMVTVMSLVSIIPGWTRIFGTGMLEKYYTLQAFDFTRYGSAFIIEYYFDYGYVGGLIACMIQGAIIGIIDRRIDYNLNNGFYKNNAFYIFLIIELIFTVRSYPFRIPGYFVYFVLIMGLNDLLFSNKLTLKKSG